MLKTWLIRGLVVIGILAILAGAYTWFTMRSMGLLRSPVYETEPPTLPELQRPALLVFSKTNGFIHKEGIPAAQGMLAALGQQRGWNLYFTDNGAVHSPALLARFDAIIWNNVSGDVLTPDQRQAFRDYLEGGGGWVGIHASGGDREYLWDWYVEDLLRAQFIGHPMDPQFQIATLHVEGTEDPISAPLPSPWEKEDEWYSFAESPRLKGSDILLTLDESTYSPKMFGTDLSMGEDHPVVWKHCIGKGRVFYSALGHQAKSYTNPHYIGLLERAIEWAAGWQGEGC